MAGLDSATRHIHSALVERHHSRESVVFLKQLDTHHPDDFKIRVVLDDHSAHVSKGTRAYLASVPNRFESVFTPTYGSWLNLVESFFDKMAKSLFRGIRVNSKGELKERLERYIDCGNQDPVVYRWTYGIDDVSVA